MKKCILGLIIVAASSNAFARAVPEIFSCELRELEFISAQVDAWVTKDKKSFSVFEGDMDVRTTLNGVESRVTPSSSKQVDIELRTSAARAVTISGPDSQGDIIVNLIPGNNDNVKYQVECKVVK